ncbi:MAG: hypothetical protein EA367_00570 [Leptolyngbya sp. DLM2.Bin15]|nr:MAG: hypothetical protein EA367_00570 [Leptolyngbya sp. DLM2.Bin15]
MPNIINSGDRVGDVVMHTREELEAQGFNISNFFQEGEQIFGFSFDRPPGFVGDFIATILQECLNDGISLLGIFSDPSEPEPEPEPEPPLIQLFEDCPISPGQRYALQPSRIEDGVKIIDNPISGAWYDPPPYQDYKIQASNGALITEIVSFPCGLIAQFMYPDTWYTFQKFSVTVEGIRLPGEFNPNESIRFENFQDLLQGRLRIGENGKLGVPEFTIEGVLSSVCFGSSGNGNGVCDLPPPTNPAPIPYLCDNSGEAQSFCVQLSFDRERPGPIRIGPKPVPEPATILGTIAFGGILMKVARSRRRS